MTEPRDELLERYADAVAQDPRRPSERVRSAVHAHAQMLRDQAAESKPVVDAARTRPAANQPQWTLSLVASLAVVALTGLLYVQIDPAPTQEREADLAKADEPATQKESLPSLAQPSAQVLPHPKGRVADTAPAAQATRSLNNSAGSPTSVGGVREAQPDAGPQSLAAAAPTPMSVTAMTPAAPAAKAAAVELSAATQRQSGDAAGSTSTAQLLDAARIGQTDRLQQLVTQGASVNARDDKGNTALMLAVRHHQKATARKLLELGAELNLVNSDGQTALQLANQLGFTELAQLIQASATQRMKGEIHQ
jgi:hypothetical protein